MTLIKQFFIVNQKRTAQPVKSDSWMNDCDESVIYSEAMELHFTFSHISSLKMLKES